MRKAVTIAGLLAVVVVGVLVAHPAATGQQNSGQGTVGWEYKVQSKVQLIQDATVAVAGADAPHKILDRIAEVTQDLLNQNGNDGWELVAVDESMVIFKRPKR